MFSVFQILIKLAYIAIIGAIKHVLKIGKMPDIIFTIDAESQFENKVKVRPETFEKAFITGSLEISEVLQRNGKPGVFFINISEYVNGTEAVKKSISDLMIKLVGHGHQIGVHIHPSLHLNNESPDLSTYTQEQVEMMIRDGRDAIYAITNVKPVAFRAGGFSVGNWGKIYNALVKNELFIDSSVFPGSSDLHESSFTFKSFPYFKKYQPSPVNLRVEDPESKIWEYPVTVATKANNNREAYFFRFDLNRPLWLLKLIWMNARTSFSSELVAIYHSKEVFQDPERKQLAKLDKLIKWSDKRGAKWDTFTPLF